MVLVDTSVWVDHFRRDNRRLKKILLDEGVLCHPFVIGELACGHLRERTVILKLLQNLPQSVLATNDEVLTFIEARELSGKGIGFIDAHLLASCSLGKTLLWTLDKKLKTLARLQGISYS